MADEPPGSPHPKVPRPQAELAPVGTRHFVALSLYWLANTVMWGALLHLTLQSRLTDWFTEVEVGPRLALLAGIGGLFGTVAQLVFGAFSDRSRSPRGRRRPYIITGTLTGAASLMILGAAPSYWPFVAGLVLLQITSNIALGPFTALLPDTVPPAQHGAASGWMGLARLAGDTGGLILAGVLLGAAVRADFPTAGAYEAFRQRQMLLLCGVIAAFLLGMMLITVIAIREDPGRGGPRRSAGRVLVESFRVDFRGNRDFMWLSASRMAANLGIYTFLEYMRFYLQYSLGVENADRLTLLVMLPAIASAVVVSLPSGAWSDRIGRKPLLIAAQVLVALGALMVAFAPEVRWVYAAAVPAGLGYGVFTAVEWALACNLVPKQEAARYLGFWNVSAVLPQIGASVLMGPLGSWLSRYQAGLGWRVDYVVGAGCVLLGAYLLRWVREERAECGPGKAE